jgi:Uma2 family endonuclease
MATAATTPEPALLTAEAFARRPDPGHPEELVEGRIIAMPPPGFRHGKVCNRLGRLLGNFADDHDLGHTLSNDSGVVTRRGPDSVRGPDVSFYGFDKVPREAALVGYPGVPPDLVAEVLSPDDRWPEVRAKAAEYLAAGVGIVLVLDPERRVVEVHTADGAVQTLDAAAELTLPAPLDGFRVAVARLFE